MAVALAVLPALPALAGTVLLVAGHRADRRAAGIALTAAAGTLAVAGTVAVTRPAFAVPYLPGVPFGLRADGLSAVLVVTVVAVLLAVLAFSRGDLGPGQAQARFFGLMLLFTAAMLVTVTATTLLALLMAWEVLGAASYALIGFRWQQARHAESGVVALLTTRAADLGLYVAAGAALAGGASGLSLDALAHLPQGWRDVVAAGIVLAALGKSAQLPFSFWLSRAMDGPSAVSAMLHSATMVAAGAYLLLRSQPLLSATGWAATLVMWAGAATAVTLGAVALVQPDLKQLLAASTSAQLGFIVLAAGAGGVAAGSAHLVAHALTKTLLFLVAGVWLTTWGTTRLSSLRGAARHRPLVGATFGVGAVALAGLAPLSLWASKDQVLAVALHTSPPLYLAGMAATALGAAYATRVAVLVFARPEPSPDRASDAGGSDGGRRTADIPVAASLVPLAAGAAGLGVLALHGVWSHFARLTSAQQAPTPVWWEYLFSAAVALVAAGVAAAVVHRLGDVPAHPGLSEWLRLEPAARAWVATPALRAARTVARADDRVMAGGMRVVADRVGALGLLSSTRGERGIESGVGTLTRGIRALGRSARRPQTGQLHHYYAQAVAVLLVLAILLVVL